MDSATYREWYKYDEIKEFIIPDKSITSVGYLVFEDKDWFVLAQNIDELSCSSITKIPKKAVMEKIMIKEKKEKA